MFKKNHFISFVAFGLVFLGISVKCIAGPSEELAQADAYWKNGNFGQAETTYKALVTGYPGSDYSLEAQKKLVMLYKHEQPQAKAAFQELTTTFSTHEFLAKKIYDIAMYYQETESYKKYEMIKLLCQYILDNLPNSEYAMWAQSKVAMSNVVLGDESSAQAAFNALISRFSEHEYVEKAAYDVAHQYNAAGNYDGAASIYQRVVNTWPPAKNLMWTQVEMAHSYISRDNDAIAQIAIEILFDNILSREFIPGALYDIAQHYGRVKKHERARYVYQRVIDMVPSDYYSMWSAMGVAMSSISLDDEVAAQAAINKLNSDFSENERLCDAVHAVAVQYDAAGKYDKAEQYYQYVLEHWPNHDHHAIWTRVEWAHLNINFNQKSKATTIIDELVAKLKAGLPVYSYWPTVAGEAYCHAAGCYKKSGEYTKAIECYKKVVDDYPTHRNACLSQCSIGDCYDGLKRSGTMSESEADLLMEQAFQAAVENYADRSPVEYAAWRLGNYNFGKERWSEAVRYYELFRQKMPQDPRLNDVLYNLGRSYEQMGDINSAISVYREFINKYPRDIRVEDLKVRFDEL
jgi:TolA-binding protein